MAGDNSCIFCKIVRKEAAASIIYEDEKALAFLDVRPINEGHTLIIPKNHYEAIYDAPEDLITHLYKIVKQIAVDLRDVLKAEGITVIQQNGRAAGQEIFHLHIHVVPGYEGQKLTRFRGLPSANREQLEEVAKQLRKPHD